MLKLAGYATGHFGKWHMGGGRDVTNAPPFSAYGFDEHASTYESPEPHPDITGTNWIWSAHKKAKKKKRAVTAGVENNLADDPFEKHNLSASQPEKLIVLRSRYEALAAQAVTPKNLQE